MTLALPHRRALLSSVPGWVLGNAAIDFDFVYGRYFGGALGNALSISRASTGYAQTTAGVLVPFAANTLRITDQGLLVEEARTNLALQSNALGNASWNNIAFTTITAAAGVSPDGTVNANRLQGTTSGWFQGQRATLTVASYTISAWVKSNTGGNQTFQLFGEDTLSSGNKTATPAWQLFSHTFTGSASLKTFGVTRDVANNTADLLVFGVQCELGAFPTSYIPTTTAAATRAADLPLLIGPAATAIPNAKAAFFQTMGVQTLNFGRFLAPANIPGIFPVGATQVQINNSTVAPTATLGSGTVNGRVKSAFGFDGVSATSKANGGATVGPAAGAFALTGPAYLGNTAAGNLALNGYMQRFALSLTKGAFDGATA